MTADDPRWEFRVFTPEPGEAAAQLATALEESGQSRSGDVYLLNLLPPECNVKIRDGELQIKRLTDTADGFERWQPDPALPFPLEPAAFEGLTGEPTAIELDASTFIDRIRRPAGPVAVFHVLKTRRHFRRGDVLAETAALTVNGARLESVAIESADLDSLRELRETLGLSTADNSSYVRAFFRLTGDEPLPDDSPYRAAGFG
jgi:hypothetical protein